MNNLKGFTVLELMIAVAITGILSTASIIPITGALQKAEDTRRIIDISSISKALEFERGFSDNYPGYSSMPTIIGTHLPTVPENNFTEDKKYGWFSNTSDEAVYCVWAVLKKGDSNGNNIYVSNRFGSGYNNTEPTSIIDCEYYTESFIPNPGHDVDDDDDINEVNDDSNLDDDIVNPKKDKVKICHKQGNKWKDKLVQRAALNGHLGHGDYLGECL